MAATQLAHFSGQEQCVTSLPESFYESYRLKDVPWGPIGYVVYKRTYARPTPTGTEEWWETCRRMMKGLFKYGIRLTREDAEMLYDCFFNLKATPAGRGIWQLGTENIEKIGADSLQNCWFVSCSSLVSFLFTMNELMLGGGVGFSVKAEDVYKLPPVAYKPKVTRVDTWDCDFIVSDNREGWVKLLWKVLKAYFETGKDLTFCTNAIRPNGAKIKGFGGRASGPEILVDGIMNICKILDRRYQKQLRDIDCLDIQNIIGSIVKAGNVRRSAQIAIGDGFSKNFINAKQWNKVKVPNWRNMSNNTVGEDDINNLNVGFWDNYNGEGEPVGLANIRLAREVGRIIDGYNHRKDPYVKGTNPCGEIFLEPFESCNLAEIYLPNIKDVTEFMKVAELVYKVCKTVSLIPHSHPETQAVVDRNHRLGISVTGFCQAPHLYSEDVFNQVYKHLENFDIKYSQMVGTSPSVKLTTVKPSGTTSSLAGVTAGMHAAKGRFYIQRIRMGSEDPIVEMCKNHGHHVEPVLNYDGTHDLTQMVVEFPCSVPEGTLIEGEVTAVDQLEILKFLQTYWADNAVSNTISYDVDELPDIKAWLKENYNESVKSVSFLVRTGGGFKQLPYEEITEEEYHEMCKGITPIGKISTYFDTDLGLECDGGSCPIK